MLNKKIVIVLFNLLLLGILLLVVPDRVLAAPDCPGGAPGEFLCPAKDTCVATDYGEPFTINGTISTNGTMASGTNITITAEATTCSKVSCLFRSNSSSISWPSSSYTIDYLGCSGSGGECNDNFTVSASSNDGNCTDPGAQTVTAANGSSSTINFTFNCNAPAPPPPTPSGNVTVSGWLYKVDGGTRPPVVNGTVSYCYQSKTVQTDSNGFFQFTIPAGSGFCIRGPTISGYALVDAVNARVSGSTYEWQVADVDCGLHPNHPNCPDSNQDAQDRPGDSDYNIKYEPVGPPSGMTASCQSPETGSIASFDWADTSGAGSYALRANNNANNWNGSCTSPNSGDFCASPIPSAYISTSGQATAGSYNWWLHACTSAGCSEARAGLNFSCPLTTISVSPTGITKTTTWPQLTLAINTNDSTASRVMVCQDPDGVSCNGDTGWTNILSSLTPSTLNKDGSPHNHTFSPPSDYVAGTYYFSVYPASTPRLAKSNKVTFNAVVATPLNASCSVNPTSTTIGTNVTWTANASGGTGTYTYTWSGTDGLSGGASSTTSTTDIVTKSYSTIGTKTGGIRVVSGTQDTGVVACTNSVTVTSTPQPDLIVDSLSPTTATPGSSVSFSGRVRNTGTATAGASSTRLRYDSNRDGTLDTTLTNQSTGTLAAGGNETETWPAVTFSTAGNYLFEICADIAGAVTESSETNNCTTATLVVSSGPTPTSTPTPTPTSTPTPGGTSPWIQTSGGDVHSNTRINTPGGP